MKNLLLFLLILFSFDFVIYGQPSEFKPSGNFWGYLFGDYYYMAHSDSLGRGAGNVQYKPLSTQGNGTNNYTSANAFQIRRFYLGYDYLFSSKLAAYVVLADEQDLDANGNNTIYLKFANLKWTNIFPMSNLIVGQLMTPTYAAIPYGTEPLMGYRPIERTIIDMHDNDNVSDLGLELEGNLWRSTSRDSLLPDVIGYIVEFGNGANAKPASNQFKTIRTNLYSSLLKQKITFGLNFNFSNVGLSPVIQRKLLYKAYFNVKLKKFKIGTELYTQDWINGAKLLTSASKNPVFNNAQMFGWSIFCSGKILENLNFFARLDIYNPDINYHNNDSYISVPSIITPSYIQTQSVTTSLLPYTLAPAPASQAAVFSKQTFYTLALDYTPTKRIHIMPNIWVDDFKSLVNLPSAASHAKFDYDFVPRISFYYIFNPSKNVYNNGMD
jgi:hypothetical protein